MRKKTWILYHSRVNGVYIVQDKYSPFYELQNLEHFIGIYETREIAFNNAKKIINYKIKALKYQLKQLKNG